MLSHRNLMTMAIALSRRRRRPHARGYAFPSRGAVARHGSLRPVAYRQGDASGPAGERRLFSGRDRGPAARSIASATFFAPPTGLRRLFRDPAFGGADREHPHHPSRRGAGLRRRPEGRLSSVLAPASGTATARAKAPARSRRCPRPCWPTPIAAGDEAAHGFSVGLAAHGDRSRDRRLRRPAAAARRRLARSWFAATR